MGKARYKIKVDEATCIGCGACASECPENWELKETGEGYKGHPKASVISEEDLEKNKAAESICPVQAIKISKA
ncbi:MAG TPA: ferredoxin [Nanoarchaeota archaeon]|nr:ferredoxin [Nanoarchaeota archaeon]